MAEVQLPPADVRRTGRWHSLPPAAGLAALLWLLCYALAAWLTSDDEVAQRLLGDVVYVVPVALAAALSWTAAWRSRRLWRRFWLLIAASNTLWLGGELTWAVYDFRGGEVPFPSAADALYLASYALVPVALMVGFARIHLLRRLRAALDATLVTLALGAAGWQLLVAPQLQGGGLDLASATGVAYPMLGVAILITLLSAGIAGHRQLPPSVVLVGIAFAVSAVTDVGYTYLEVVNGYSTGSYLGIGWQVEAVLLCLAALSVIRDREDDGVVELFGPDLGMIPVFAGVAAALGVLVLDGRDGTSSATSVVTAVLVMAGLAVRLWLSSRDAHAVAHQLRDLQVDRALLLEKTLRAGEEERIRLSTELHDGPVQRLSAVGYQLERAVQLFRRDQPERGQSVLSGAMVELRGEVEGLRRVMSGLRPPALDEGGLENAVRDQLDALARETGVDAEFVSLLGPARVDPDTETVLYRVAQEALLNIAQHAGARRVRVVVERTTGAAVLTVADDGVGFSNETAKERLRDGHFGLVGMRERVALLGGTFYLDSASGKGTRIIATLPQTDVAVSPAAEPLLVTR